MNTVLERVVDAVEWHEGMLLAPQHFQLLAARLDTLVAWQTLAAAPLGWGVRRLVLDVGLLPGGLLRVQELSAIMPDGSVIDYLASADPDGGLDLSLAPFADQFANGPLAFYVAVPRASRGHGDSQPGRFLSVCRAPVEDRVSEAQPVEIPRQVLNLTLCAGAVPSGQYVHLPLGELYKEGEVIRLGERLPPLLEVRHDSPLWLAICSLLGKLRGNATLISRQMTCPTPHADERLRQLELRDRLRSLVAGLPLAETVLRTPQVHPWTLYAALVSLAGSLCLLKPGAVPPIFPDYNHADPLSNFTPLLSFLHEASADMGEDVYQHKFVFNDGAFELALRQAWIADRLLIGVRGASELSLRAWMNGALIGSASVYPSMRSRRVLGAVRRNVESVDALSLRSGPGFLLFEVEVRPDLVIGDETLRIANPNENDRMREPQEILLFVKNQRSTP